MHISNRLFPYPVLAKDKDDYETSTFEVDTSQRMNGVNSILFRFEINMDNKELKELIKLGKAEYVIHIENSSTAFRTTIHSSGIIIEKEFPIGRLSGKVEMVAFVIAKDIIEGFYSDDFNEDYKGITFSFGKANILAYDNLNIVDIIKNPEEFNGASSIFTVYKRLTEGSKPMDVELSSNKIRIGLGTEDYNVYSRLSQSVEFQAIVNAMVVLPALVYVFEELKQENGIENYRDNGWFISLESSYMKRGVKLKDEIMDDEKMSIVLAQEAMELPLSAAFSKLSEIYDGDEEEV